VGDDQGRRHQFGHVHPEFLASLKLGKEAADNRVERSLNRRAVGYSDEALDRQNFGAKRGFRCARSWLARLPIVA
jgi:hypothetical protein